MRTDICDECGSGILDGEHIANYPCSRRAESIRTDPNVHAAEGDERIRTAVCEPGTDSVYELHAAEFAATLTDEQLAAVTDAIRGSSKRGRRRRLLPAEILALAAIYAERKRRHGVSNGF